VTGVDLMAEFSNQDEVPVFLSDNYSPVISSKATFNSPPTLHSLGSSNSSYQHILSPLSKCNRTEDIFSVVKPCEVNTDLRNIQWTSLDYVEPIISSGVFYNNDSSSVISELSEDTELMTPINTSTCDKNPSLIPSKAFHSVVSELYKRDTFHNYNDLYVTSPCNNHIIEGLINITTEFIDVVELNKQMLFNKLLDFLNNYTVLHNGGKIEHEDWIGFFNDIYNHALFIKFNKIIFLKDGIRKIGFNISSDYDQLSEVEIVKFNNFRLPIENKIKKEMIDIMQILHYAVNEYLDISLLNDDSMFCEDFSSFYSPFKTFTTTGIKDSENKTNNLINLSAATTKNAILTRKLRNTQYSRGLLEVFYHDIFLVYLYICMYINIFNFTMIYFTLIFFLYIFI
jgi:hypothetical protein